MRSDSTEWHGDKVIKNTTTKEMKVFSFRDSTLSLDIFIGSSLHHVSVLAKAASSRLNTATLGLYCQHGDGTWRCLALGVGGGCNGEVICAIICIIHTCTHIGGQAQVLMCVHKHILMYEMCKNQKKNVFLVTLYPQGVYFLLFRLRNPLSAHTRTHVHCISASSLSIPPLHHTSLRGAARKNGRLSNSPLSVAR